MKRLSPNALLLLAALLIVLTNGVILGKAWYNRSAAPDSLLVLTERELQLRHSFDENSGLSLQLNWRNSSTDETENIYSWNQLSDAQLASLGIRPLPAVPANCCRQLQHQVLAVLEFDGPLYRAELQRAHQRLLQAREKLAALPDDDNLQQRAENLQRQLESIEQGSRLYVAALGHERQALRQRFPDRQRHAIVQVMIRAGHDHKGQPRGWLEQLLVNRIHVPQQWHASLHGLPGGSRQVVEPKFRISVAWGRNLEPWLQDVRTAQPAERPADNAVTGH